jgi:two-component system phosphate regulon sensor histidine kinase PhoR
MGDAPEGFGLRRVRAWLAASPAAVGAGGTAVILGLGLALSGQLTLLMLLALLIAAAGGLAAAVLLAAAPSSPTTGRGDAGLAGTTATLTTDRLIATAVDPVIVVDRRGRVLAANPPAASQAPLLRVGRPVFDAIREPDLLAALDRVVAGGPPELVRLTETLPQKRMVDVQVAAIDPMDAPSQAEGRIVALWFRDLTALRQMEDMRSDFVANASHELRTPLASLLGFIETLQGPARNDPAARERFLAIMAEQARRMARLIDDLLSLSRIELNQHLRPDGQVRLGLLVEHIIETMKPLTRELAVEIAFSGRGNDPLVAGERDELIRVIENLVDNAVKYGAAGGRVEVSLSTTAAGPAAPGMAVLTVRDFGSGIAPEHLPRLTERFYRVDVAQSRSKGGTGLGLALVKHIVARHGGRLAIESEPGRGATFRVELPLAQPLPSSVT